MYICICVYYFESILISSTAAKRVFKSEVGTVASTEVMHTPRSDFLLHMCRSDSLSSTYVPEFGP